MKILMILFLMPLQVPFCEGEDAQSSIMDAATKSVQLDCSGVSIVSLVWEGIYD